MQHSVTTSGNIASKNEINMYLHHLCTLVICIMIPWLVLLLMITKKSKIVQGYATINHQSLESTKCGQTNAIVK